MTIGIVLVLRKRALNIESYNAKLRAKSAALSLVMVPAAG
jgi:hypothetical protein